MRGSTGRESTRARGRRRRRIAKGGRSRSNRLRRKGRRVDEAGATRDASEAAAPAGIDQKTADGPHACVVVAEIERAIRGQAPQLRKRRAWRQLHPRDDLSFGVDCYEPARLWRSYGAVGLELASILVRRLR